VNSENLVIPFQINDSIKGTIVRLSTVASKIINDVHSNNIKAIFSDSIAITASIGSRMKNDGVFSFQAQSDGVIKTLFIDLNNNSSLRGYISLKDQNNIQNLSFNQILSNGTLALNIKEGKFSKNYQGLVEINGQSIEDTIHGYFNSSEQVKSYFRSYNIFKMEKYEPDFNHIAGAIKLELMPEEKRFNYYKNSRDFWDEILMFLKTMDADEFLKKEHSSKEILGRLFGQYEVKIFDEIQLNNNCKCSDERVLDTLKSMGKDEIQFLFDKRKEIEVVCEFCKTKRIYQEIDIFN